MKELFPPVVITIPSRDGAKNTPAKTETDRSAKSVSNDPLDKRPLDPGTGEDRPQSPAPRSDEIKPCTVTTSEERITLQNNGGNLMVMVGAEGDADLKAIVARSSSPADITLVRELDSASVKGRALFLIRSISKKPGLYQVTFELPCGKKDVQVSVR
jgi:hypothetical protein